jgi:DNA-binding NtrC family response regulator
MLQPERQKRILLIDETGFCRICSAILVAEGFCTHTLSHAGKFHALLDESNDFGLIVTSYPYGLSLFESMRKRSIPTLILSDHINTELLGVLEGFDNSYCMIKPLDYEKFRDLVRNVMEGEVAEGYRIV